MVWGNFEIHPHLPQGLLGKKLYMLFTNRAVGCYTIDIYARNMEYFDFLA